MSFILPCTPPKQPVHAIDNEGKEEYAEENPWVHMQFDKAEQDEQAAVEQDAGPKQQEQQVDPTKVLEAFASARGELDILLGLIARLREGQYFSVGRVERPDDMRVRDLARDKLSRVGNRTTALAAAAQALRDGANALAAAGQREDAFYSDVAKLQQYWKLRPEPPSSAYAFSIDLDILPTTRSSTAASGSVPVGSSAPAAAAAAVSGATGSGGSSAALQPLTRVGLLKDPSGTVRLQLEGRRSQGVPSVLVKEVAEPSLVYIGPAAVHGFLLSQLKQQLWAVAGRLLTAEVEANLGYLPPLPISNSSSTAFLAATTSSAPTPPVAAGAAAGGATGAAAAPGASTEPGKAPAAATTATDPRQRLYSILSLLVMDRLTAAAPSSNGRLVTGADHNTTPLYRDPSIVALRPLVLQHVVHQELQHLQLSASAAVGASQMAGGRDRRSKRGAAASLIGTLVLRLIHSSMRGMVRQVVDEVVARHPGVLVRSVATTRTCCSGLQLLPAAVVEAGLPAPSILLLVVERDVVVESGFSTGSDPSWLKDRHRAVKQAHQLQQALDQLLPQLLQLGQPISR